MEYSSNPHVNKDFDENGRTRWTMGALTIVDCFNHFTVEVRAIMWHAEVSPVTMEFIREKRTSPCAPKTSALAMIKEMLAERNV